ncbi:MAG: formyltransferase [Synergistaceae bacterium]|jgi:methionyl-tRNA formyltransferase|nr:formyltransferase [Synergistaceae bacterium]
MTAVVFAYSSVGCECLEELLDSGVAVPIVFTHEDDPGEERWFRSVRELAEARGVPVILTPQRLGQEEAGTIRAAAPDVIFSFYYRFMIPEAILALAPAFNMHGSLLPRYRGRACVNWAVLNGEAETGVTLHHMVARPDAGRIVDQEAVSIGPDETAIEVFRKIIPAARICLRRALPDIIAGRAYGVEQDESKATYFGRRRPEDGLIDWSRSAREVHNLVRAVTHPFPGAFTFVDGRRLFIWSSAVSEGGGSHPQGGIPCGGGGALIIKEAQWE